MIAIPNTEKPKDCWDCFNYNCGHWGTHGYDYAETDCPLIEIDDELFKKAESAYVLQQIRERRTDDGQREK
jgi:hypothetical protein